MAVGLALRVCVSRRKCCRLEVFVERVGSEGQQHDAACWPSAEFQLQDAASTHDVYFFCASMLPSPRRGVTAKQLVEPLATQPAPPPRSAEQQAAEQQAAAAVIAEAPTREAAAAIAARMEGEARITPPMLESAEAPDPADIAADVEAAAEWEVEQEVDQEAAAAEAAADERIAAVFSAEEDTDPDYEEGCGDFQFDESGARIDGYHSEALVAEVEQAAPAVVAPATYPPEATASPPKRQRSSRKVTVISQPPGVEASTDGVERRVHHWGPRQPGMFSASNYFWLYYAAKPGLKEVPVGQLAQPGECHSTLDEAEDIDADSIAGSNSTYEFIGASVKNPEMLFTRVYPCACPQCRERSAVSIDYSSCPNMTTVGRFVQETIHAAVNVVKKRSIQKLKTADFAKTIKVNCPYAAFASFKERGDRSYWLLLTKSGGKQAEKAIKVAGGTSIRAKQWVVEGQWYASTSDDQGRKSYKLLPEIVYVPVASLVQEHGLEWHHEGRSGGDSILSQKSHLALISHNYSNVE